MENKRESLYDNASTALPLKFGPVSGNCFICGKHLGAYWNKKINLDTGKMACEEHNKLDSPLPSGFVSYSDG